VSDCFAKRIKRNCQVHTVVGIGVIKNDGLYIVSIKELFRFPADGKLRRRSFLLSLYFCPTFQLNIDVCLYKYMYMYELDFRNNTKINGIRNESVIEIKKCTRGEITVDLLAFCSSKFQQV